MLMTYLNKHQSGKNLRFLVQYIFQLKRCNKFIFDNLNPFRDNIDLENLEEEFSRVSAVGPLVQLVVFVSGQIFRKILSNIINCILLIHIIPKKLDL